jgi:hypothetical protein
VAEQGRGKRTSHDIGGAHEEDSWRSGDEDPAGMALGAALATVSHASNVQRLGGN